MSDTAATPDVGDDDVLKGITEATEAAQRDNVALTYLGEGFGHGSVDDADGHEPITVTINSLVPADGIVNTESGHAGPAVMLSLAGTTTGKLALVVLDATEALMVANRLERAANVALDTDAATYEAYEAEQDAADAADGPRWPGKEGA